MYIYIYTYIFIYPYTVYLHIDVLYIWHMLLIRYEEVLYKSRKVEGRDRDAAWKAKRKLIVQTLNG